MVRINFVVVSRKDPRINLVPIRNSIPPAFDSRVETISLHNPTDHSLPTPPRGGLARLQTHPRGVPTQQEVRGPLSVLYLLGYRRVEFET